MAIQPTNINNEIQAIPAIGTNEGISTKDLKKAFKKVGKVIKKLGNIPTKIAYSSEKAFLFQVESFGPKGVGKTSIAKVMATEWPAQNISTGLRNQGLQQESSESGYVNEHAAVNPFAEWFTFDGGFFENHPGERLTGKKSKRNVRVFDDAKLIKKFKGATHRLAILNVNPYRTKDWAKPALFLKIAAMKEEGSLDIVYYATQILFEMDLVEVNAELVKAFKHADISIKKDTDDLAVLENIKDVFKNIQIDLEKLCIVGGSSPIVATYLLEHLAKVAVKQDSDYIGAVSRMTEALDNTIMVFTHFDQASSTGMGPSDVKKLFRQIDKQANRCADDRIWVSSVKYRRLPNTFKRLPSEWEEVEGIEQLVERIKSRSSAAKRRIMLRKSAITLDAIGVISILGIHQLL